MKTHTIKTPTAELLVVELPKNQNIAFGYYSDQLTFFDPEKDFRDSEINFDGNWEVLGKPDEIREEDAELFVESFESESYEFKGEKVYRNYKSDIPNFWFASESLLSLLESEIFWENPTPQLSDFEYFLPSVNEKVKLKKKFEEAEQKTFDRNRTLIFKKN